MDKANFDELAGRIDGIGQPRRLCRLWPVRNSKWLTARLENLCL